MSLASMLAGDRRRAILEALCEDDDGQLSELMLRRWVTTRVDDVDRDQLRAELRWMEKSGLVGINKLDAGGERELWMVKLLELGRKVAGGKRLEGVTLPEGL